MKFTRHIRSQHAKRGRSGFSGPDTYVAVTIAPDSTEVPYTLNAANLRRRGIKIHYFGEGYSAHRGPKSSLGKALQEASEFIRRCESSQWISEQRHQENY